jgi:hypothetical protein
MASPDRIYRDLNEVDRKIEAATDLDELKYAVRALVDSVRDLIPPEEPM